MRRILRHRQRRNQLRLSSSCDRIPTPTLESLEDELRSVYIIGASLAVKRNNRSHYKAATRDSRSRATRLGSSLAWKETGSPILTRTLPGAKYLCSSFKSYSPSIFIG